ncbi:MAG: transposase [Actinomycetota bacterium]|nr:transposase [Actinomycetota bacterium]
MTIRRPDWALGFADEVWWSRIARPHLASWAEGDTPLRLVERTVARGDPDPKALACYGLLIRDWDAEGRRNERLWLRFVDGRPISGMTTQFLGWCCARLAAQGKRALLLVWDNASWHVSKEVRRWITAHNRAVRQEAKGVRIVVCPLPSKSPWLNPIEPKWMHGKRRIVEPARLLTADEIAERVCACFDCLHEPHLHSEEVP